MIAATSSRILLLFITLTGYRMCGCAEILAPSGYRALSGDLRLKVRLEAEAEAETCVQVLERPAGGAGWAVVSAASVRRGEAVFPCGVVSRGGHYGLRLATHRECQEPDALSYASTTVRDNEVTSQHDLSTTTSHYTEDEELMVGLDVRWPEVSLDVTPRDVMTYPEQEVVARVSFQGTHCQPAFGTLVPETWLSLVYCGHSPLSCTNSTLKQQLLYSEQIRGYPSLREIPLPCNSFGLAGHYTLALRSSGMTAGPLIAFTAPESTVKAEWSDKFVFNVHARSIFPCDGHGGVTVLFQYPACILESGDRVRVFGRLRADVGAAAPPSSLHYLSEQRVTRGQHSMAFECDVFTERYVEYCFVYVSQAVSGAVSDVRVDCVPTLPVHEAESGGWGSWSAWTRCTTTCSGGTRNRYRLCDSPPPRYGAKFCEGHPLETERCGVAVGFDCPFYQDGGGGDVPAERPEVRAEVGPGCRCGCVVHLGAARSRRLVAASSQSCPGRTFWLVQADRNQVVRLSMEQFRLPCGPQWLKVRDGDALSSTLLAHLTGVLSPQHVVLNSTGNFLLLEFFSDEEVAVGEECWGGFLAHVQQLERAANKSAQVSVSVRRAASVLERLALVHIAVILLLLAVLLASSCLGAQYLHRYRKYQLAAREDLESLAVSVGESEVECLVARSRATSSTTLLSEVISLRRLRHRHTRLADQDTEQDEQDLDSSYESHRDEEVVREGDEEAKVGVSETLLGDVESRPTTLEVPVNRAPRTPHDQPRVHKAHLKYKSPVSPVAEKPESVEDEDVGQLSSPPGPHTGRDSSGATRTSVSSSVSSSLTNALSSPASSLRSNPKEKKEKRNRERLLAGSEFSLAGEMEMDYYDYNVSNASAVPGSYLGMDPAFCLWIPPFAPGRWDDDEEEDEDRLLGAEETELRELSRLSERTVREYLGDDATTELSDRGSGSSTPVNVDVDVDKDEDVGKDKDNKSEKSFQDCYSVKYFTGSSNPTLVEKQMKMVERLDPVSPVKVHRAYRVKEKESGQEKSPSDESEYYDLLDEDEDEIKFADDDDEDEHIEMKERVELVIPQVKSNRSSYYDV